MAERLGDLHTDRRLEACPHPLAQEIWHLLSGSALGDQPLVAEAKSERVKIVAVRTVSGYTVCLQPLNWPELPELSSGEVQRQQLQETIKVYQESHSRQELFMRTLAHDVRSPLATLHMLLVQAHKEQIMPTSRYFTILEDNIHQLEALVDGLLELIELQKDRLLFGYEISFSETLKRVERQLAGAIDSAGASIHTRFAADTISFVPTWLESILRNLISNGIKYASPGRPPQIQIETSALADGRLRLCISDNGRGFKGGKTPSDLFQPFMRYHKDIPGTGLGLSLVKSMLEKNGGSIRVTSTGPEGTSFELTFVPYREVMAA